MKITDSEGTRVIALSGRIDSGNAPETEREILSAVEERGGREVRFDAENLTYISSAGLRILMKVRKILNASVAIENVSRDVYDIFETTGFTELFHIKKAYPTMSVEGLEVIGRGLYGTVYRIDPERIVKVYRGADSIPLIEKEKEMAQKAFLAGIPTAISYDIVRVGEDYGTVFELLNARTFHELAQEGREAFDAILPKYVELLKLVHHTEVKPGTLPSCREFFLESLDTIRARLPVEQYERLRQLLTEMNEENTIVHCDIQMKNVMLVEDEPMLIDMNTMSVGNPVFDLAGLYVTYQEFEEDEPDNSEKFLEMKQSTVDEIWKRILEGYFDSADEEERRSALIKIRLVAAIRFLYLLEVTDLKNGDLGARRIAHTIEHIGELLPEAESLAI